MENHMMGIGRGKKRITTSEAVLALGIDKVSEQEINLSDEEQYLTQAKNNVDLAKQALIYLRSTQSELNLAVKRRNELQNHLEETERRIKKLKDSKEKYETVYFKKKLDMKNQRGKIFCTDCGTSGGEEFLIAPCGHTFCNLCVRKSAHNCLQCKQDHS